MNTSEPSEPTEQSEPRAAQPQTLAGRTLVVTAERRAGELAAALQRRGAVIRHAPALSMVPHVDDQDLLQRTRELIENPPGIVVITTGVGLRGWLEAAAAAGLADDLLRTLGAARLIARGPKARGALQANGLHVDWVAESETSAEIIDVLLSEGVTGASIAVQHHGAGDDGLHRALADGGAEVRDLIVYKWGPPPDADLVRDSARWAAAGEVDGVLFTSAPAAAAWLDAVRELGVLEQVVTNSRRAGAGSVVFACVGPVTAAPLIAAGVQTVQPERFRMGALVRAVIAHFDDAACSQLPSS